MASSVFFKFKSSKEPTRVEFDGTGISVFELKREIILRSGLGDGTDFELVIYADDASKEVYDDDTTIIPRSTTVVAQRMPPKIPGRGGAARYVSGKMPVHAKNSSRREQAPKTTAKTQSNTLAKLSSAMTEEEKMAAVFAAQTEHFTSREEEMSTQQYVHKGGPKKPANVPDHEPPQGYICYRCGEKGHWIQLCPTNDNPEYDNRPRVKRTTGIPKSFLKTVDKATALGQNADGDDSKAPSGIMVNADGEFVIAEPDKASWEQFQAKAKSNAVKEASAEDKAVQEQGLECPIDKKMFIEPMKTPCCGKTYCNDCITNALIESDFVCPACKNDAVLIDDLKVDDEAVEKIKKFLADKDSKAKEGSKSPSTAKSPVPTGADSSVEASNVKSKSPSPGQAAPATAPANQTATPNPSIGSGNATPVSGDAAQVSKKRPAEEALENPKIPKAPKAMQKNHGPQHPTMMNGMMNGMNGMMNGMPGMGMPNMMFPGMPMMGNFGGMGMPNMPNMPNMNMNMMNPMMNPMMGGMGGFPPMNSINGMNGMNGMNGNNFGGGMPPNGNGMWGGNDMNMNGGGPNMGRMHGGHLNNGPMNNGSMNNGPMNNGPMGFPGPQQRPQQPRHQPPMPPQQQVPPQQMAMPMHPQTNFMPQGGDEEDAYFRKPVNPHRHQNRQRRIRPSDYREL
ncbi:protein MPE1 [Podospora fimiseda]|uniref:Protein MPE1 n=1 Tax=Podospora fimiseda TaxID=252190 RepID=A0AAN7BKE4_9PEZI|nr:protein MPE1 [Podospora fimiseda]